VHPLPKKHLGVLLRYQRIDYLNGLKRIELRPRISKGVGHPFGFHLRAERLIVLYSAPATWTFPATFIGLRKAAEFYGASITTTAGDCLIEWKSLTALAQFMYCEVFLHELGHHHDRQYRRKRSLPKSLRFKEASADLHAVRLNSTHGLRLWRALVQKGELADVD
jgi:hypothetical protein